LRSLGLHYRRGPVTYYDYETFDGELTSLHKDSYFNFQKEYRIMIMTEGKEPLKVRIPGLKEFSSVVKTEKLNTIELRTGDRNDLQQYI
jgi:hypothetical protein